jgi:hypothetical protein
MAKILEVKAVLETLQLTITHQTSTVQKAPIHEEKETV